MSILKNISTLLFIFFLDITIVFANEIVFINIDMLLNDSNQGKIIVSKLSDLNKKNEKEIKKKESELFKIKNEIDNLKNILNKEELEKKVINFNSIVEDFNKYRNKLSNEYEDQKNNELKLFFNSITPILDKYMSDNSIKIIIDKKNIFLANKQYDITEDILNIINKLN